MSTPITNNPRGIVSLLGLRDMGGVPRALVSEIQTGIDVTQFLLVDRSTQNVTQAFNAVGNQIFFTVPPGELWYIHAFGARSAALGAGQKISMAAGCQVIATSDFVPLGEVNKETATGAIAMCVIPQGFWLNPGGTLMIQVTDIAAGPVNVSATVSRTVLRV
jgi:hypothetical protein